MLWFYQWGVIKKINYCLTEPLLAKVLQAFSPFVFHQLIGLWECWTWLPRTACHRNSHRPMVNTVSSILRSTILEKLLSGLKFVKYFYCTWQSWGALSFYVVVHSPAFSGSRFDWNVKCDELDASQYSSTEVPSDVTSTKESIIKFLSTHLSFRVSKCLAACSIHDKDAIRDYVKFKFNEHNLCARYYTRSWH